MGRLGSQTGLTRHRRPITRLQLTDSNHNHGRLAGGFTPWRRARDFAVESTLPVEALLVSSPASYRPVVSAHFKSPPFFDPSALNLLFGIAITVAAGSRPLTKQATLLSGIPLCAVLLPPLPVSGVGPPVAK